MSELIELYSYPFMQKALICGFCISLCAALIGVILVLKKYSMIGHGLGEVGFAALSLALAFNLPPLYVSIPIVVIASFIILAISQKQGAQGDVTIALVSTGALAFGVIITSLTSGFNMDVCNYMFGSILSMKTSDVILSVGLSISLVVIYIVFYNRLFSVTYDEEFAKTTGISTTFYQFMIAFITALVVVLGMRMMGTLLISSLIVFPAIISKKLTNSFKGLVVMSSVISVINFFLGLNLSYFLNLPTGASIVAVNICILLITVIYNKIYKEG